MKKTNFPKAKIFSNNPKVIVLGKFNSLHQAHLKLLEKAKCISEKENKELVIMMFCEKGTDNILSFEEKIKKLNKYLPTYLLFFKPNKKNFSITKDEFIKWLKKINVDSIVVGENFRFGNKAQGSTKDLKNNFKHVDVVNLLKYNSEIISTKKITTFLERKDFKMFKEFYGDFFSYEGNVVKGKSYGKKLNMPTANVDYPKDKFDLESGVYFSYAEYKNKTYPSLTSIAFNPTFNAKKKTYETFIFNFDKDIYGEILKIKIIDFYREQIKFDSFDELKEQLVKDKKRGEHFFKI